ncbi:zinc finger BED domain-containing protein RICESLEEPER 2-like [Tasmannia lanceolata]|uniref:zinc finger BED domain-containing protein RICESLEEPER 2-like n=1 Tax=Tasmannia lanceolata TaxID=3420 RepID=UPI004063EE34
MNSLPLSVPSSQQYVNVENVNEDDNLNISDSANETIQDIDTNLDKKRKKKSDVWVCFVDIEIIESGKKVIKHKCKGCQSTFTKMKGRTTSTLKRHMNSYRSLSWKRPKQSTISFLPVDGSGVDFGGFGITSYDQMKIREIIAKMIIMHEYPFKMVEHTWFNILCKSLNLSYEKMSMNTIKVECMKVYEIEKKLKKNFKDAGRISLTSDCWTSNQTISYMCLTAHFVDSDWKLQRPIISFCDLEPPHFGVVISDAISTFLTEWGIQDKVQSITLDNARNKDVAANQLKINFQSRNKLHYKGKIFHIRCCAHNLNLMVHDGLKEIDSIIQKIRESVEYLKKSTSRLFKFGEIARQLDVPTSKWLMY